MQRNKVDIKTADGTAEAWMMTPDGVGPWPSAVIFMDAYGVRPALCDMAARLASAGYCVLLPNLYYRSEPIQNYGTDLGRDRIMELIGKVAVRGVMKDMGSFLECLDAEDKADATRVGTVGYCMGGKFALSAAGVFPDRVRAGTSFHGGGLATDDPLSPPKLADKVKGIVYVGSAEADGSFPPEQRETLGAAYGRAGVTFTMEEYIGAKHGFAVTDHSVFNEGAAARHWRRIEQVFEEAMAL